jgi:hypothetical protein
MSRHPSAFVKPSLSFIFMASVVMLASWSVAVLRVSAQYLIIPDTYCDDDFFQTPCSGLDSETNQCPDSATYFCSDWETNQPGYCMDIGVTGINCIFYYTRSCGKKMKCLDKTPYVPVQDCGDTVDTCT